MSKQEDIERLNEIVYEIRDLIGQTRQIAQGTSEEGRFEGSKQKKAPPPEQKGF